ncbi:DNA mismatch repair protein MutS [Odoribacter sp. OttesenSCG-928-A06]|nr:DNA mismatch repair protein MutS [Odoribacter sp. OttesenSCG-928-A06]
MQFKDALIHIKGFRFIAEHIPLSSSAGRRLLYETPFTTDREELEKVYDKIEQVIRWEARKNVGLQHLRDIRGTLNNLSVGYVLGDIDLFEIKELALLSLGVRSQLLADKLTVVNIPDVSDVVKLLDPEGTRVPNFYIYDLYDEQLAQVRAAIRKEKEEDAKLALRNEEIVLEDKIRGELSRQLKECADDLSQALEGMAELDLLVGKAEFAVRYRLCRPVLKGTGMHYINIRHLEVEEQLQKRSMTFQPVSVDVEPCATIITGANMAGKSVLLKSLMLAQYMAQFGMWVAAEKAEMTTVDKILVSMGDEQDEQRGLSSFAAEMLSINKVIEAVRVGVKVLALIDEPARTTNPEEGKAIVSALVDFLNRNKALSMVTTHYSGLSVACRRLRVKGFLENKTDKILSLNNIDSFIDYTLIEDKEENVPHEALRIAEILGVDKELTDKAKLFLNKNDAKK